MDIRVFVVLFFGTATALPTLKIVGGDFAEENQLPYQVALLSKGRFNCGGSIISNKWILTAAHCVDGADPKNLEIYSGSIHLNRGGIRSKVKNIYVHEGYGDFKNDVALLQLADELIFNCGTQLVKLHRSDVPNGTNVTISGWGREFTGGNLPGQLKFNRVLTMSQDECGRLIDINYEGIICLTSEVNNGACNGDSGGPAVYDDELVGVANFVINGCGSSYPDGYAKVSYFVDWIETHIGHEKTDAVS